jgi:hypothetical protein
MLGPPKTRDLSRPVLIAFESFVPQDHFYRHLHRVLDLRAYAFSVTSSGRRGSALLW